MDTGISVVAIGLASIPPSSELERALQAPTFEAQQQRPIRRCSNGALAIDKERAITENELVNQMTCA